MRHPGIAANRRVGVAVSGVNKLEQDSKMDSSTSVLPKMAAASVCIPKVSSSCLLSIKISR